MTRILTCGRVVIDAFVFDGQSGVAIPVDALVDTGAEVSIFPQYAMPKSLNSLARFYNPVYIGGGVIHTFLATNAYPGIWTGSVPSLKFVSLFELRYHNLPRGTALFGGVDSVIGMDLLDEACVNLIKDASGLHAYLRQR